MKLKFLALLALPLIALASDQKADRKHNVNLIGSIFEAQYAPMKWKQEYAGFDLNTELNKVLDKIDSSDELSLKEFQRMLRGFIYSTQDYHVGIRFLSTESATLPFQVKGVKDKYFISYIDRSKLPNDTFPFVVGDELVKFGDKSVPEAIKDLLVEVGTNVPSTDRALAEMSLTSRTGAKAMYVPKGPIALQIKDKLTRQVRGHQLSWDYKDEKISPLFNSNIEDQSTFKYNMSFADADLYSAEENSVSSNPHLMGAKRSFIPRLGKVVWESSSEDLFDAYVYQTENKNLVGVVRIFGYMAPEGKFAEHVVAFAKLVKQLESSTDALIIDQVNNPGGSVFYLYALASLLSDQPLAAPLHEMKITQADVIGAIKSLEKSEKIKNDDDAKALYGKELHGYPVSYQFANFDLNFSKFIINEWNAGKSLTAPFYIGGVEHINPYPAGQYTKPIMIITNALDFSGGDFFPAIMQDNKRATIFGARTAGAGGYVLSQTFTNRYGIERFTVTGSLAERLNKEPIENLGVTPDIPYEMTEKDLTNNYSDYIKAINDSVQTLIK